MKKLAAWYQKKISSYDKEEWETMVEQLLIRGTYRRRIIDYSQHPRSYLIDVDLVRGSSFPKAKPTLGMRRVVWYALVRLVFLPVLYQWWVQQTSSTCAKFLLGLWLLQILNIAIYFSSPATLEIDASYWLVPLVLMVILSIVHSQIVSTTEMELARVRPRSTYRRKIPRSFIRRQRSECEDVSGGGSAESAAASTNDKTSCIKLTKHRRRVARLDADNGLRLRKKDKTRENLATNIDKVKNIKPSTKIKDSDDEDYQCWNKPDLNAPIVTFTPPSDDKDMRSSFSYRYNNLLTRKQLESFNVGKNINRLSRPTLADGDDGFESLNGYISNGSDGENRSKEIKNSNKILENVKRGRDNSTESTINNNDPNTSAPEKNIDSKEEIYRAGNADIKHISGARKTGVRFRKMWTADVDSKDSSDEEFATISKKAKKLENYQSSSSEGECSASAPSIALPSHHTMSDWVGQTTNSEESSYCTQSEAAQSDIEYHNAEDKSWDPFAILESTSDTVKCTLWERGAGVRAELSAVDISWCVVARAERALAADGALSSELPMAAAVALVAPLTRLVQVAIEKDTRSEEELQSLSTFTYVTSLIANYSQGCPTALFYATFGDDIWEASCGILSCALRLALSALVFFLVGVAERAYKQRFLYAKLFAHLTSARRARKSQLPHFRLNTVRNIKTWLSTRSYLRRRGPQRSVDVIVSAAFMFTLVLLACVSAQLLRDSMAIEHAWLLEAMVWSACLGIYLLRLLTLGSNVNRKYRGCLSALLTEQINLHLAIEQRPDCKDQLTLTNNVLKLATDLLKELDAPFRISGICANHYLYTITKVVILSALSGVLSEMLGFKLKLHKIKIK